MPNSFSTYQVTEPLRSFIGVIEGNGTNPPTRVAARNASVSRISAGRYRFTFPERQFSLGAGGWLKGWGLQSATAANLAGCTVVAENYNATTRSIDVVLFSGGTTPAVRDLAAGERLSVDIGFLHG